jgi:drug/metabolite transporter (DMT)-like permease
MTSVFATTWGSRPSTGPHSVLTTEFLPTEIATGPDLPIKPASAPSLAGLMLAAMGSVAFSGKAIIVKLAYRHGVDAITLIMLRMLFALPFFIALAWWAGRGRPALTVKDWVTILGLGFSGYYLASYLDFMGLAYITAGFERLILYQNPVVVLLLGYFLFKRPVTRRQVKAMSLSYLGVMCVLAQELRLEGSNVWLGAGLIVASTLSYALYLVYCGEVVKRLGSLRLTGLATTVACVLCLLQFLWMRPVSSAWAVAPAVIWLSVLNATLCTFAPVVMVMMAIERIGSTATAQTGMLGPVSTILLGVLILGEPFSAWVALGTVLVMSGVWLLSRPDAKRTQRR